MLILIVVTTILTYFVLYSPQPLLPLLANSYDVSRPQAALLITAAMLPMSLAPISYGYILESVSAVKLLRGALLMLGLTTLAFGMVDHFGWLLAIRLGQGLLLPAILTSVMTYLSVTAQKRRQQWVMSVYIAATIAGGYFGRLLSGLSATLLPWQAFFWALGVALLITGVLLSRLPESGQIHGTRPTPRLLLETVRVGAYLRIYAIIFCMFFIFAAFMNFLPFRVVELWETPTELLTGLMYTGYLVGLATSLGSGRAIGWLGSERNTLRLGIAIFGLALSMTIVAGGWLLFGVLFIFCGAMFLVHATAAGLLNRLAARNKGIVNGVYIAVYYSGGVLGSYVPGLLYERFGWPVFVASLLLLAGLALAIAWRYPQPQVV